MTVGERISQLLEQQDKKAKDLARFLSIDASSVTGWAHGSYPSSKHLVGISQFFGVSVDYILTGEDSTIRMGTTSDISEDGIQVGRLWERLDEAGRAIVLGDIYRRLEVAEQRHAETDLEDSPILKDA